MNQITNFTDGDLPVKMDEQTLKSMYYGLNAKPDTHIKVLPKPKLLELNDVFILNEQIQNKLKNHNLFTNITTVTVGFDNGEVKSFNAWETFKNTYWEVPEKTQSISLAWDMNIQVPGYKLPQKHTLKVRIGSSLRPNEMFYMITNGDNELELKENFSFVVCKVDFINVVLSKELIKIVEDWYNILKVSHDKSWLQQFFEKNSRQLARTGHYLTTLTGVAIWFCLFKFHLKDIEIIIGKKLYLDTIIWGLYLLATYFVSNLIGSSVGQIVFSKIQDLEEPHHFAITKGDLNKQTALDKKNNKISKNIMWQFIVRLVVALIMFAISSLIKH